METQNAPCSSQCRSATTPEDECRRCAFLRRLKGSGELGHRISKVKRAYCFGCAPKAENFSRLVRRRHLKEQGAPVWKRLGFASAEAWRAYHRENMAKLRAKGHPSAELDAATLEAETQPVRRSGALACAVNP